MKYSRFFCVLYLFLSLIRLIHLFTMDFFLENWYELLQSGNSPHQSSFS